jgi:THO complex subunit 4
MVHLNISNLPASVVTSDLEELFQDFKVFGVAVHYNETGEHLGTADLFVDAGSGKDIIREFTNIAIDGQEIKIALVDETAGKLSIRDRVERVARNPIYRRKAMGGSRRSVNSPRSRSGGRRSGGGGGGKAPSGGGGRRGPAAGGRAGAGGKKLVEMSAADLDKELEAYMGIRNSGKDWSVSEDDLWPFNSICSWWPHLFSVNKQVSLNLPVYKRPIYDHFSIS